MSFSEWTLLSVGTLAVFKRGRTGWDRTSWGARRGGEVERRGGEVGRRGGRGGMVGKEEGRGVGGGTIEEA